MTTKLSRQELKKLTAEQKSEQHRNQQNVTDNIKKIISTDLKIRTDTKN